MIRLQLKRHSFGQWESFQRLVDIPRPFVTEFWWETYGLGAINPWKQQISATGPRPILPSSRTFWLACCHSACLRVVSSFVFALFYTVYTQVVKMIAQFAFIYLLADELWKFVTCLLNCFLPYCITAVDLPYVDI